jgi:hypothetical protein
MAARRPLQAMFQVVAWRELNYDLLAAVPFVEALH